jgi:hypothetical protein
MTTTADKHIGDHGVATATSGAATDHHVSGQVTSESLTTAAGSTYTLTLTNKHIVPDAVLLASVALGTSTQGTPQIVSCTPSSTTGSGTIVAKNIDSTNAFNGTIVISFLSI